MNKKRLLAMLVLMLLVSGCAYMREQMGYGPYIPPEPSSAEIMLRKYNDVFFNGAGLYDGDLRVWIEKDIKDVKAAFEVEPGKYGCCGPDIYSFDVDGNGYISYKSAREIHPYRSGRLTFYCKRYKIYNVVKER
jgi:hypothetical protein